MIQVLDTVDVVVGMSDFCCRRIQQLEARSEALEAKLDASACESGQAMRRAQRQEGEVATLASELESLQQQMAKQQQEADTEVTSLQEQLQQQQRQARADVEALQKQLEAARQEARGSQAAAADEQARARDMQMSCSRQMHELELRVQEAIRQAQSADRDRQRLEAEVAAAEVSWGTAQQLIRFRTYCVPGAIVVWLTVWLLYLNCLVCAAAVRAETHIWTGKAVGADQQHGVVALGACRLALQLLTGACQRQSRRCCCLGAPCVTQRRLWWSGRCGPGRLTMHGRS